LFNPILTRTLCRTPLFAPFSCFPIWCSITLFFLELHHPSRPSPPPLFLYRRPFMFSNRLPRSFPLFDLPPSGLYYGLLAKNFRLFPFLPFFCHFVVKPHRAPVFFPRLTGANTQQFPRLRVVLPLTRATKTLLPPPPTFIVQPAFLRFFFPELGHFPPPCSCRCTTSACKTKPGFAFFSRSFFPVTPEKTFATFLLTSLPAPLATYVPLFFFHPLGRPPLLPFHIPQGLSRYKRFFSPDP